MIYTEWLPLEMAKDMYILDEVPYKYFRNYCKDDTIEFKFYHINNEDERNTYLTIMFEFELKYDDCSGVVYDEYGYYPDDTEYKEKTKKFKTKITYKKNSPYSREIDDLKKEKSGIEYI